MRITIQPADAADLKIVEKFISDGFDAQVAKDFQIAGRVGFRMYGARRALADRIKAGAGAYVALDGETGRPVGYLEMRGRGAARDPNGRDHITLLFVDLDFQRQGIARQLLAKAIELARACGHPDITINASRHAKPIYARLGFVAEQTAVDQDGFIFTPMRLKF